MKHSVAIGDKQSALQRMRRYVEQHTHYLGRPPATVVLFAEDYDALDLATLAVPYRVARGPSVEEYRV